MDFQSQARSSHESSRSTSKRFAAVELRAFQRLLQRRLTFLRGNVRKLEDEACHNGSDASGDLSKTPLHPADQATDIHEQNMSLLFMENENLQIQDIEDALERIREELFGLCEECEREIALERLRAIPYTRLCVDCKRREEEAA
jgi:DnaK suppressor protein